MNETLDLLMNRGSVRRYKNRDIPDETLDKIIRTGIRSPTAGDLQSYSIIVVRERERKEKLAHLCDDQAFISSAPVLLVFCIDSHRIKRWAELSGVDFRPGLWTGVWDSMITAQTIAIAAEAQGLGSVYIGDIIDNCSEIMDLLRLPEYVLPIVMLCIGYPDQEKKSTKRIDCVVFDEEYNLSDDEIKRCYENAGLDVHMAEAIAAHYSKEFLGKVKKSLTKGLEKSGFIVRPHKQSS
jgi:nitroreductase